MPVLHLTRLPRRPGGSDPDSPFARASDRHRPAAEDGFADARDGAPTLFGESGTVRPGRSGAAEFPAGDTVENRPDAPAVFLIVGTRAVDDRQRQAAAVIAARG